MIHSQSNTDIGEKEFELMQQQQHFETVWAAMQNKINRYMDDYLDMISSMNPALKKDANYSLYLSKLIDVNDAIKEKYGKIFAEDIMDEYQYDVDAFKGVTLQKDCDIIRKTLNSKSEALNDWKGAFFRSKAQPLYDTFFNFLQYARDYDHDIDEAAMADIDSIDEMGFDQMDDYNCYLIGIIGTGIVSNILSHMWPRVFPGNFKIGMFALYFLSDKKSIEMKSETSEFLMIKDDVHSKTGIIEADHNFFYPYQTFALYSLRIYRMLNEKIKNRFKMEIPSEYRYLLSNDFYEYVFGINKELVHTLTGSDDILKFGVMI